jgi:hypothetical protein
VGKSVGEIPVENLRVNGSIILKWLLNRMGAGRLVHLPQDKDTWRAVLNTVINHKMRGLS